MGYGDEIMASAAARGALARGVRIAFGDGTRIRHHPHAEQIFRYNPNVAPPGSEKDENLEWVANYAGKRPYNRHFIDRWIWVPGHGGVPGEIFFSEEELAWAEQFGRDFVLIEPNVAAFKSVASNKQWAFERYAEIAHRVGKMNRQVLQFQYPAPYGPGRRMSSARQVKTPSFRQALAVLSRAALYVGPEGGLHHGAAALGVPAVVIFGGFIPPSITGYASHVNFFAGGEGCGSLRPCQHCRVAMESIRVGDVASAVADKLRER